MECILQWAEWIRGENEMPSTGKEMPASGLLIYNSTTKTLEVYDGSAWQAATPTP